MSCWQSIQNKYGKWTSLNRLERFLLVYALILLPVMRICRRMGLKRVKKIFLNDSRVIQEVPGSNISIMETAHMAARIVAIADAHTLCRTSCLDRSLVLCIILNRLGIAGELHVGVRKEAGMLEAHAWVEVNHKVLNDTEDVGKRFLPFSEPLNKPYRYFR